MRNYRQEFSLARMAVVLGVTRGSYYKWSSRGISIRDRENRYLLSITVVMPNIKIKIASAAMAAKIKYSAYPEISSTLTPAILAATKRLIPIGGAICLKPTFFHCGFCIPNRLLSNSDF